MDKFCASNLIRPLGLTGVRITIVYYNVFGNVQIINKSI